MATHQKGFTLVEVLVVTAILSVTLVVLYSGFQIGMAAYKRTEENLNKNREGEIFVFQLSQELTQSFPYLKSSFHGREDSIVFPTELKRASDKGFLTGLYAVEYRVEGGTLVRSERKLRKDKLREEPAVRETIFEGLSVCRFEYLMLEGGRELEWRKDWLNQPYVGLPRAVRLTIGGASSGDETKTYEILIPHGVLLQTGA